MSETGTCYRHADRTTGIHCTRCANLICTDCMIQAPVGHHCPACVAAARPDMRRITRPRWTLPTGKVGAGPVIATLVVVNVLVYALSSHDPTLLNRFGQARSPIVNGGEYYRLLTAAFLHLNLAHLVVNMVTLVVIGPELEAAFGRVRFVAVYLLSAVGGSVAATLWDPRPGVGASTAVYGVLGALLAVAWRRRLGVERILLTIVFGALIGLVVPVGHIAHAGGLATGLALGLVFEWPAATRRRTWLDAGACVAAAVVLGGLVLAAADPFDDTYLRVLNRQLELFGSYGLPYETAVARPPELLPYYRTTKDGKASYRTYQLKDPSGPRTVRLEFGDGRSATATVPRGSGWMALGWSHRFPGHEARYEQRVSFVGAEPADVAGVTDVCPHGTRPVPEDAEGEEGETPMCVRP